MTTEQLIIDFLQENAKGKSNAVTADEIFFCLTRGGAELTAGRTQEKIRNTIKKMVTNQSVLIGSNTNGYYIIDNAVDAIDAITNLLNRANSITKRANELKNEWNIQNPHNKIF